MERGCSLSYKIKRWRTARGQKAFNHHLFLFSFYTKSVVRGCRVDQKSGLRIPIDVSTDSLYP